MAEHETASRPRRAYRSPLRARRAEEHRRAILRAARELFAREGYAGTTLEAIAEAADLSPKTVVAIFGSKRAILAEVLDPAGQESIHTAVLERLRMATQPQARLALVARLVRDVYEQGAAELDLLRGAGTVAPELAELAESVEQRRRRQQKRVIEYLRQQGALRADRSDEEALDDLWALTSFDLYRLLVLRSGWRPERYEVWLAAVLAERLLPR